MDAHCQAFSAVVSGLTAAARNLPWRRAAGFSLVMPACVGPAAFIHRCCNDAATLRQRPSFCAALPPLWLRLRPFGFATRRVLPCSTLQVVTSLVVAAGSCRHARSTTLSPLGVQHSLLVLPPLDVALQLLHRFAGLHPVVTRKRIGLAHAGDTSPGRRICWAHPATSIGACSPLS